VGGGRLKGQPRALYAADVEKYPLPGGKKARIIKRLQKELRKGEPRRLNIYAKPLRVINCTGRGCHVAGVRERLAVALFKGGSHKIKVRAHPNRSFALFRNKVGV